MTDHGPEEDPTRDPADPPARPERGGPPMAISEEFRRFDTDQDDPSLFTDKVAFLLFALTAPAILLLLLGSGLIDPDLRDDVPGTSADRAEPLIGSGATWPLIAAAAVATTIVLAGLRSARRRRSGARPN